MAQTSLVRNRQPVDLHPLVDPVSSTIEFRFVRNGRFVRVHLLKETLVECFGVDEHPYGLLKSYEEHRDVIDAAVLRQTDASRAEVVLLSCDDLRAA